MELDVDGGERLSACVLMRFLGFGTGVWTPALMADRGFGTSAGMLVCVTFDVYGVVTSIL